MKKFLFPILFVLLLSAGCGSSKSDFETPSPAQSNVPTDSALFDFASALPLAARLQVIHGNEVIREIPTSVQWLPVDPDRPHLGKKVQAYPVGMKINNLKGGEYLFRVLLYHRRVEGNLLIGSIETATTVKGGEEAPIELSKATWNYQYDEDGDGFTNIAEILNGQYAPDEKRRITNEDRLFQVKSTDPRNSGSHPDENFVYAPMKIVPTSPDSNGNSKVVGDPLAVRSGTLYALFHFGSDGRSLKEKIEFSSKIDGSFVVDLKGSEEGDQVAIVALKAANESPAPPVGEEQEKRQPKVIHWLKITYRPLKMLRCWTVPNSDQLAGSGSVYIEGEGINVDPSKNEVFFPNAGGNFIQATDLLVSWEGPKSRELKVKIPPTAVSGYPRTHVIAPKDTWGECPVAKPVAILQNASKNPLPDLMIPRVEAPRVALVGQTIEIDIPILNQGVKEVENNPFSYQTYLSPNGADKITEAADRKVFPDSTDFSQSRRGSDIPEEIIQKLEPGKTVNPPHHFYTIARLLGKTESIGPLFFKAMVDSKQDVDEQNEGNNSRASAYETFVHYVDLQFRNKNDPTKFPQVYFNRSSALSLTKFPDYLQTDEQLIRGDRILQIQIAGILINEGTFPMIRKEVKTGSFEYLPVDDPEKARESDYNSDPLNSVGKRNENDEPTTVYQKAKALADRSGEAEGENDLLKPRSSGLVEDVDLLNRQTELPILIHLYYSQDNQLVLNKKTGIDQEIDQPLQCKGDPCEFCINRLERQKAVPESSATPSIPKQNFNFTIPLDTRVIRAGKGSIFIVAHPILLDPVKMISNVDFDYCNASNDQRRAVELVPLNENWNNEGERYLLDFDSSDNIIRIPINF